MELERRYLLNREVRAKADNPNILEGYGIVYNEWTDMGGWLERVAVGAADDSAVNDRIKSLFNHDANWLLGFNFAQPTPTLRLAPDQSGVFYEVDLPPNQNGENVRVSVQRGDITGNSFGFYTKEDRWGTIDGKEYRELILVQLVDIGPVTFEQYEQTDVALRSMFGSFGIDCQLLSRALVKVGRHDLTKEEREAIKASMDALDRTPDESANEPDGSNGSGGQAGRLALMRMKLEIVERLIR